MEACEIKRLILERHRECGIGLCGRFEVIARWLFREHNILTSDSYVAKVIAEVDDG